MKVGTWNLRFLFDAGARLYSGVETEFTKEFVEKRFAYFAEKFDLLDCDVLFLQELGDESALKKIVAQTKTDYSYFVAEPDQYGTGNAVIYKTHLGCKCESVPTNASLPVFKEGDEDTIGPRIWSRRDYVKVETEYQSKPLVLLGVHVKARFLLYENGVSLPESPEELTQIQSSDAIIRSEMFRMSQWKKIREVVDEYFSKDEDAQIAVLGDFNIKEGAKRLEIVTGNLKDRSDALVSVMKSEAVDHVFVSKYLYNKVSGAEALLELQKVGGPEAIESDHAPMIFELQR